MFSKSITLPNRYAQHPAIICPLAVTVLSRICPLPGFLSTRMFQHVDGCFYSQVNFTILERILRLKPWHRFKAAKAATGSTPAMNGGACASLFGHDVCVLVRFSLDYKLLISLDRLSLG